MSTSANKSICLQGNLKSGSISYHCYPVDEFRKGQWFIGISSVSFKSATPLGIACLITSNFVTSQRRTSNGDIVFYQASYF